VTLRWSDLDSKEAQALGTKGTEGTKGAKGTKGAWKTRRPREPREPRGKTPRSLLPRGTPLLRQKDECGDPAGLLASVLGHRAMPTCSRAAMATYTSAMGLDQAGPMARHHRHHLDHLRPRLLLELPRLLEQLDLPRLLEQLDLPRLLEQLDVPRLLEQLDLPRLLELKLDLPRLLELKLDLPRLRPRASIADQLVSNRAGPA
jgi:hypothetical protein